MPDISKINALAIGSVAKVDGLAKASILDIDGVAVPSAFTGLLDTYTGAAAAYSTRRLYSLYTGAALRVREDSGDTETDIGFDSNGDLDTAAIATHCGSANGYVVTWYGQESSGSTGSGNDATQSTASAQPQIYNGTSVLTNTNGNVAIEFIRQSSTSLSTPAFDMVGTGWFCVTVAERRSTLGDQMYIDSFGGVGDRTGQIFHHPAAGLTTMQATSTGGGGATVTGSITTNVSYIWTSENTLSNLNLYINGSSAGTASITSQGDDQNGFDIGKRKGLAEGYSNTYSSEIIYWPSNQSSNRTGIETDINDYFSIFTP